jgi:hypothetical protein
MPSLPWGHRRSRADPTDSLLIVPVVSPQRAVHEERALIKPHDWTRAAIQHRLQVDAGRPEVEQPWQPSAAGTLADVARQAATRLGVTLRPVEPASGEHLRLAIDRPPRDPATLAVGTCCSIHRPELWFTLGRLVLHQGGFWRRQRGRMLHYSRATDVHLPRPVRQQLADLLRPRAGK